MPSTGPLRASGKCFINKRRFSFGIYTTRPYAKKYSESEDTWQARVTRNWRFYFKIIDDTYLIEGIQPHPKK